LIKISFDSLDRHQRLGSRGYTMVELMTVCIIISILAAMSFALLSRMRSQAIETNALAALNSMATGYEMYYYENSSYPQWGPGEAFQSPTALLDYFIDSEYLPRSWGHYSYDPDTHYIYGITQDYAVEIPEFNALDPTISRINSYFIIFHPYNFQRDALAIGNNPRTGWVAVRARKGKEGENYRNYPLYVFRRGGAD
jgi:prepilin-type N-terminal cleavage/methylation domain-containing protein